MADLKSIREGSRSDEPRKRPLAKVSGRVSISRTLARPPLGETWPCLWAISSDHSPRSNPSSKVLLLKGTATDCTARRFLFFRTLIHSLPLFHLTVFFLQNSGPTRVGYARKLEKKKICSLFVNSCRTCTRARQLQFHSTSWYEFSFRFHNYNRRIFLCCFNFLRVITAENKCCWSERGVSYSFLINSWRSEIIENTHFSRSDRFLFEKTRLAS